MASLLPGKGTCLRGSVQDNRQFMQAVLWKARNVAHWRDLPIQFGIVSAANLHVNDWE
ncbi:transposase [Rhodocytophaga rosea]